MQVSFKFPHSVSTTSFGVRGLTLTLLTWRIWRAPNNASKWQMGFNSVFKGLIRLGTSCMEDVSLVAVQ